MKHDPIKISTKKTKNIFFENYFFNLDKLCTPPGDAQPGKIVAFHNGYEFGLTLKNSTFRAAVMTENGIKIMSCEDMIMNDLVDRDEIKKFIRANDSMPFLSMGDLHQHHYDRCEHFRRSPSFSIFMMPYGIVSIVDGFDRKNLAEIAQEGDANKQTSLHGFMEIYVPEPRSAHEEIQMAHRMKAICLFKDFIIKKFCPECSQLIHIPVEA